MKSKLLITLLLALSLLVTACGPADETTDEAPTEDMSTLEVPVTGITATEAVTDVAATEAMTATTTTEATTDTSSASSTQVSTAGTATAVTISVNDDGTPVFLVDDQGRALYAYLLDTQGSATSTCMDDCAVEWPAVLVTGTPTAGEGVDSALLGTITRDDGQMQATYNGWPLYYFDEDLAAGDMNGQGMDGEWFLVSPAGEPIQL